MEDKELYTDEEICDLADWFNELTIKQAFFLRDSYLAMLEFQAKESNQEYVQ